MIRVLLVDDHAVFRQTLAVMLDREPDIQVVGSAGSIEEARDLTTEFDVAVLDLDLPGGSGIDLIPNLRAANRRRSVLVLTALFDRLEAARAIEAGAGGVMRKTAVFDEIVASVRALAAGKHLHSVEEVVELLRLIQRRREADHEADAVLGRLTPREREVLALLAEGLSDREMAERLIVSIETVHGHMTSILGKLGVQSRLQALIFAIKTGLVEV